MADIVLDANVLDEFLAQYFGASNRGTSNFQTQGRLGKEAVYHINRIRTDHECGRLRDVVVASVLSFVELARAWRKIDSERLKSHQVAAFLQQPPEWFSLAPLDEDLVELLLEVPATVVISGRIQMIELFDAIHVATALSRGTASLLITSDQRLIAIPGLSGRVFGG